jgi:hypothetical protein
MKHFCFVAVLTLMLTSCYFENKIQKQGALDSRDPKQECFIEFMDGKIISYNTLKVKNPPLQYQYLEGNGEKLTFDTKEIRAFQTEKFYAYKLYDKSPGVIGKLPFNELFAERIVNGKIELFVISEMTMNAYGPNSSGYQKTYYIRKGKTGVPGIATKGNLKNLISDNKSLLEDFESLYKRTYPFKSIMKILEAYN